jgi:DNA polymerase III delta subunit
VAPAPDLKPVYLLTGTDRPKIETALARLRRHFEAEAVELVTGQDLSGPDAVALCNVGSLFGDARLVVVEGVDGRRNSEGRLTNAWKVADVKAVTDYLASPAPGTVLALVAEELKKDAPLVKACAKAGDVLAFDVPKRRALASWVRDEFKKRGVAVDLAVCQRFVELVGEDATTLSSEVEKLVIWANREPIGDREVEELATPMADIKDFAIFDAWGAKDVAGVLRASEDVLERDPKARRDVSARVSARLGSHILQVAGAHRELANGVPRRELYKPIGARFPWQGERAADQAANFSEDELRDAVVRLAGLDHALKGGSKLAPDLELQRALIDLSAER